MRFWGAFGLASIGCFFIMGAFVLFPGYSTSTSIFLEFDHSRAFAKVLFWVLCSFGMGAFIYGCSRAFALKFFCACAAGSSHVFAKVPHKHSRPNSTQAPPKSTLPQSTQVPPIYESGKKAQVLMCLLFACYRCSAKSTFGVSDYLRASTRQLFSSKHICT